MLDDVITQYIQKAKREWLRRKITPKAKEAKINKLKHEADRLFTKSWLEGIIKTLAYSKDIDRLKYTTHTPKFSHPDVKLEPIHFTSKKIVSGIFATGNVTGVNLDMYSNSGAAYLKKDYIYVYEFLISKLSDRQTIIEHLYKSTQEIKSIFSQLNIVDSFDDIRESLIKLAYSDYPKVTSNRVKQVYFPVNDDYHLLSLLPASPLMAELKLRIHKINFSNKNKKAKKAIKNKIPIKSDIKEIFNLTKIGFGGANKQNISILNNKDGGYFYLLSSMPPILEKRQTQPPKRNFFDDCLWTGLFKNDFEQFHKVLSWRKNNLEVRDMRDDIVLNSITKIKRLVENIREIPKGWSDSDTYNNLAGWQKIWLDNKYIELRNNKEQNQDYLSQAQRYFANWFINNYKQTIKNSKLLGDDDIAQIKKILKEEEGLLQ